MPGLPILNLPSTVFQLVLGFTNPFEIFDLSLCSLRTSTRIRDNLPTTFQQASLSVTYGANVLISLQTRPDEEWKWAFYNSGQLEEEADNSDNSYQLSSDEAVSDEQALNQIIDLFKLSEISSFKVKVDELEGPILITKTRICRNLDLEPGPLNHEEMKRILESFEVTDKLTISCNPGTDFDYDKAITTKSFIANNASWLNRKIFLNLDCEKVEITDSRLISEDFNAFLYQWMASDNTKLQYLRVEVDQHLEMDKILHNIQYSQGTPKRMAVNYRLYRLIQGIPFENGMDLRRSDGKWATVIVLNDQCSFLFVIWQHPNPNRV